MKSLIMYCMLLLTFGSHAQINAKLMRYMDVSPTHIAFVYGGDIWTVAKDGGMANQLTHSPGEESWPKFSPDGKHIAFTAGYNGSQDIYVMPVTGGVPTRVTYRSFPDRMVAWHPDGKRLLIASSGEEGGMRLLNQFFLVDKDGGMPEKLPLPYGELASFSPDGKQLAYITKITENYPFKRIRSGNNSDVLMYDFATRKVENITNRIAIDGKPAWVGKTVYFLSDENPDMRLNIWAYETDTRTMKQVTDFKDYDISYLSGSSNSLVFEMGGDLFLMDHATRNYKKIPVQVATDLSIEMPRQKDVSRNINNMTLSPDGKRVIFEARGELFNVPATEGFTQNLTRSSGAFDQTPAWSPDGKNIAYWSDQSGEYEIWIQDAKSESAPRKLSAREKGFGYTLNWSPDNKKIAFLDEKHDILIMNATTGEFQKAGNTYWTIGHSGGWSFPMSWSPDSRWLAFPRGQENANTTIMIYDTDNKKLHQATSGFYSDNQPVFSSDGKYLFLKTDRNMEMTSSDLDNTWIYPNATMIGAISLSKAVPSLLQPKNDTLTSIGSKKPEGDKKDSLKVVIDFDDLESRMEVLPIKTGNMGKMEAIEGKILYIRGPRSGSGDTRSSLWFYDLKEREEKLVMDNVGRFVVSGNGKMVLVQSGNQYGVIAPSAAQKIDKQVPVSGLVMQWVPKQEWEQIFQDTWRRYRDFFYDPNMQKVDWDDMRKRYGSMMKDARTRWDVSNLMVNMLSELSAGHTYVRGGDVETTPPSVSGYLGIEWAKDGDRYKIGRIRRPAPWNTEVRSPFDRPGVDVQVGDHILAVNGIELNPKKDPYAAFEGLGGKTVSLLISRKTGQTESKREVVVACLNAAQDGQLRYLEWVERNRQMVDKLSGGKLGYVYMSNTAEDGHRELVTMYYGQLDKQGFIIDERFNGGGQLADRFLELLQRPVTYNLHWRYGRDHTNPIKTNTGPKGMLINGWAGSGGDGLPWAFKVLKAGPIVGENTLGILVGPATGHNLIDGGGITVPGARLYDNAGHWFWEGEGVSPDIRVWDDPNLLMQGRDPQIERVVQEVLKLTEKQPSKMTPAPPYEDRRAKGLRKN